MGTVIVPEEKEEIGF